MEHHEDLHLIVVSPESTLFDGKVEIVTLPGELGSFSVLYDHIISLVQSLILIAASYFGTYYIMTKRLNLD